MARRPGFRRSCVRYERLVYFSPFSGLSAGVSRVSARAGGLPCG